MTADSKKSQVRTQTYFVSSTKQYRKLARIIPELKDTVLEVGASYGNATEILAQRAQKVVALDHSREIIHALETRFKNIGRVETLWHDARDIYELKVICPKVDVLFFDVGGDAPADVAIYMTQLYILAYHPRVAVIRNISLAGLLGEVKLTEFPDKKAYLRFVSLPKRENILAHYQKESSKSANKFIERVLKRETNHSNT